MKPRRGWRWRDAFLVALTAVLVAACTICIVGSRSLVAAPGEWSAPVRIGLFGMGPVVDVRIAPLLEAATSRVGVFLLDGRSVATRFGTLRFARVHVTATAAAEPVLAVACARCRVRLRGLGDEPLAIDDLRLTATRRRSTITGTVALGAVNGRYVASIDVDASRVDLDLDRAPLAAWYALFADRIPETRLASIGGTAAFRVRWSSRDGTVGVEPSIEGFAVTGLGTERLVGGAPAVRCAGVAGGRGLLPADGWLARAVIAAEDRRYRQHPGYDLVEVAASLSRNAASDRVERGASTVSQQLARILFVGSDRTLVRKLRELLYAVEMEDTLGKSRILQQYLAVAPWGDGTCGAEAAARRYFGVAAARLDPAQAVWLAALLHAPDAESRRWLARGGIDLARATWVANGLETTRARRARIVAGLVTMAPPPPPPLPSPTNTPSRLVAGR